jgi:hypothetical protein
MDGAEKENLLLSDPKQEAHSEIEKWLKSSKNER